MPFETREELKRLQAALKLPVVSAKLDDFAIGTLHYYQTKFEKSRRRGIHAIYAQLKLLDPSSLEHQEKTAELNALSVEPDLGFYYTIFLFDKLVGLDPNVINKMIRAVLSFDTLGNYLLVEQPVILEELTIQDGALIGQSVTVILDEILKRRGIDVSSLKVVAQQNRESTAYFSDDTIPIEAVLPSLPTISLPTNIDTLSAEIRREWQALSRQSVDASVNDALRKRIAQVPFAFDLLSQEPTPRNIERFFVMAAELFDHAKMQDSAKLFTLNAIPLPKEKSREISTVAQLQNSLSLWFVLSLVQAVNVNVFNQRLQFIVAAFNTATQEKPPLPVNTTADVFLPLFQLAAVIDRSVLQFHPSVTQYLSHIKMIASKHNPDAIANYTNSIKLESGPLAPMRMFITRQLALNSEIADMIKSSLSVAELSRISTKLLQSLEDPALRGTKLSEISAELSHVVLGLARIAAESSLREAELSRISAELSSITAELPLITGSSRRAGNAGGSGGAGGPGGAGGSEESSRIAAGLSRMVAKLSPIVAELAPIAAAKATVAQGWVIYNYFNPKHQFCSNPKTHMSETARIVLQDQQYVNELLGEIEFIEMLELLASTFVVHEPNQSIGRQLRVLHNCLNLVPPQIFSSRDKALFEGRAALDYAARKAEKISKKVRSQDAEYVDAVKGWCATILTGCQQELEVASDKSSRPEVLGEVDRVVPYIPSPNAARRAHFGLFRKRACSHPLPNLSDQSEGNSVVNGSVSCPSSLNVVRHNSFFEFLRRRSGSYSLLSSAPSEEASNGEGEAASLSAGGEEVASGSTSTNPTRRGSLFNAFRRRSSSHQHLPAPPSNPSLL